MNCLNCELELPRGKLFCPNCGTMNKEQVREAVAEAKIEEAVKLPSTSLSSGEKPENYYRSISYRWKIFLGYIFISSIINTYLYTEHSYVEFPYMVGFSNLLQSSNGLLHILVLILSFYIVINYYKKKEFIEKKIIYFIFLLKLPASFLLSIQYGFYYVLAFLVHLLPLIYFYADKFALNYISKITGKEFKYSEQPDSRDYKHELLILKDTFLKSKKGIIVLGFLLLIYIIPIVAYRYDLNIVNEEKSKWSAKMGDLRYNEADLKCKSIGMQLPSIEQLKTAYKYEITKSWYDNQPKEKTNFFKKDVFNKFIDLLKVEIPSYWSSTPYDSERYYNLNVLDGSTRDANRGGYNGVRCRR
jgi:hypothetical protein